jgi:hypothetical protein
MQVTTRNVRSFFGTISIIAEVAKKYKSDWTRILIKYFSGRPSLENIYDKLQLMYAREDGEIIQRPIRLFEFGRGDCDDQATAIISYLLYSGVSERNIFVCLCGRMEITHVYALAYYENDFHGFDLLPDRRRDVVYVYSVQKFYRLSDILAGIEAPLTLEYIRNFFGLKKNY